MRSLALAFSIVVAPATAQHLSAGVKGGVALTDAFSDQTNFVRNGSIRLFSESKDYIVGPKNVRSHSDGTLIASFL